MTNLLENALAAWSHSPGALRLGSTLLHFVWQGALLAAVAAMLMTALQSARPHVRYLTFVAILLTMAACPLITFYLLGDVSTRDRTHTLATLPVNSPGADVPALASISAVSSVKTSPVASISTSTSQPPRSSASSTSRITIRHWLSKHRHWVVTAWLAGVCTLSLRLIIGLIGAERARRFGITPAGASLEDAVVRLSRKMGIRHAVQVLQSTFAEVPALVGWLRPVILLPASAISGLSPAELEALLAHELAHVRRHDYLVNLLQTVIETLLFYHPAIWWLSRRIRQEREHCCDDEAIAICRDRLVYARALTALEGLRVPPRWAVAARGGSLLHRIRRIVGRAEPSGGETFALVAVGALLLLVVGLLTQMPPTAVAQNPPAATKPEPKSKQPWSAFGRVTDAAGQPLAGVTVAASTGHGTLFNTGTAQTGADGRYDLRFGPGIMMSNDVQLQAATISVHKSGFFEKNLYRQGDLLAAYKLPEGEVGWGKTKDHVILPEKPRQIDFVMLPAARVAGKLIDKNEQPLVGYSVSLRGPELPPSSGVVAATKTDDQGRFVLPDVPTGYEWQFLIEPTQREPPWNAWASGLIRFAVGSEDIDLFVQQDNKQIIAKRFELQVVGEGVNWKQALEIGAAHQRLSASGNSPEELARLEAASLRLDLSPPAAPRESDQKTPPAAPDPAASKANLKRTKPDETGRFTLTFDNPQTKADAPRWTLDPEKHQVIFQVFVRDAAGKLVEKIFQQLPAREAGGYRVNVQVKPDLIDHSSVSITFVTIQPNHDAWVQAFFHQGKGTSYKGLWSGDSRKLSQVELIAQTIGWLAAATGQPASEPTAQEPAPPGPREFNFRVVTTKGEPVVGAKVTPTSAGYTYAGFKLGDMDLGSRAGYGRHGVDAGSIALTTSFFPSLKIPLETDAQGYVRIMLPQDGRAPFDQILKKIIVTRIGLTIDHPNHPRHDVYEDVETKDAIVLPDSTTVEIRARQGGEPVLAQNLYPIFGHDDIFSDISQAADLLTIRRVDLASAPDHRWLRIVQFSDSEPPRFSDAIDLKQHQTNPITLEVALRPGARVAGHLSENVPRPVKNGRVLASMIRGAAYQTSWAWHAAADIAADGTFDFPSLPPDENLQVIAFCDGWVSSSPSKAQVLAFNSEYGFPGDERTKFYRGPLKGFVDPRLFRLTSEGCQPVIPMEPALSCEVIVLDQDDRPIEGAKVGFQANQRWFNSASQFFGEDADSLTKIRKLLAKEKLPSPLTVNPRAASRLSGDSNAQGIVLISNLPPGSLEKPALPYEFRLSIWHKDYTLVTDAPPSNAPFPAFSAKVLPNQPNRITVRMQKK